MARSEVSLFETIKGAGVEAAVLTTYSCHFPFLEQVILRQLRRAGVRQVIVLADRSMLSQSILEAPPRRAGRDYVLLPVDRSTVFHPKVALLVGKRGGVLSIGSNNLTLAGYSWNHEVASLVRASAQDAAESPLPETWQHVKAWIEMSTMSGEICREEITAFEEVAPWLHASSKQPPETVVAASSPNQPLWDQVVEQIKAPVERVTLVGAFFDARLDFIRRVRDDLTPLELVVGVEPQTVSVPAKVGSMEGVKLVDASRAWKFNQRYLHAKCILIEDVEGGTVLATGSANPSRPAWLESGKKANVEMILIQQGDTAKKAADRIGLGGLSRSSDITEEDLEKIEENWRRNSNARTGRTSGPVLVVTDFSPDEPSVELESCSRGDVIEFLDGGGEELHRTRWEDWSEADWTPQLTERVQWIHILRDEVCVQVFLLQRHDLIRDARRPPEERRFREALGSLDSGEPKLREIFGYVEKLIGGHVATGTTGPPRDPDGNGEDEGGSLVGKNKRHRKRLWRLRGQDNLGYLLDVLMRELGRDLVNLDAGGADRSEGRSEEELIGQEDEDVIVSKLSPADRKELIEECHRRVRRLVKRMALHLEQFRKGEEPCGAMLMRLVAVLGVMRVLKSCDGEADWVPRGQTALPDEDRWHLLHPILSCVVEGDVSLVTSDVHETRVLESEEWAHVRSFLLWLAFYCGCDFTVPASSENASERKQRIWESAIVVALAKLIDGDKTIVERARDLVEDHPDRDKWFQTITRLDVALQRLEAPDVWEEPGGDASLQIAAHMSGDRFLPRLVYGVDGDNVEMTYFGKESDTKKFKDYAICTADLARVLDLAELEV
jgi:hypothetical protein